MVRETTTFEICLHRILSSYANDLKLHNFSKPVGRGSSLSVPLEKERHGINLVFYRTSSGGFLSGKGRDDICATYNSVIYQKNLWRLFI